MSDKQSRTEQPTLKKLKDAKKKGQVVKSNDLNAAASFFVFTLLLGVLGQYLFTNTKAFLRNSLTIDYSTNIDVNNAGKLFLDSISSYFILVFPFMVIAVIIGLTINIIQTGFVFTTNSLKPDFKKLNPIEGFKNIFSSKSLFNLVKNLLKLGIVVFITYSGIVNSYTKIFNIRNVGLEKTFMLFMEFVVDISFNIAIVMLALGVIDYIFQSREYKKNLRMTKQEVKDEHKEIEGNPEVKSARRQKQRQMAMSRMMSNVVHADVIITNPTHIAIALRYDTSKDMAPIVIAKGADYIAEKLKGKAKENNIPIIEDKPLARNMYSKVDIGDYVPVELYKAIAEILAIVYQMKEKNKKKI